MRGKGGKRSYFFLLIHKRKQCSVWKIFFNSPFEGPRVWDLCSKRWGVWGGGAFTVTIIEGCTHTYNLRIDLVQKFWRLTFWFFSSLPVIFFVYFWLLFFFELFLGLKNLIYFIEFTVLWTILKPGTRFVLWYMT